VVGSGVVGAGSGVLTGCAGGVAGNEIVLTVPTRVGRKLNACNVVSCKVATRLTWKSIVFWRRVGSSATSEAIETHDNEFGSEQQEVCIATIPSANCL
jgi:hypothetical protein